MKCYIKSSVAGASTALKESREISVAGWEGTRLIEAVTATLKDFASSRDQQTLTMNITLTKEK